MKISMVKQLKKKKRRQKQLLNCGDKYLKGKAVIRDAWNAVVP